MESTVNLGSSLLMIFVKNPELGKVKTRLAKSVGDQQALDVYTSLLEHTHEVSTAVNADKAVFYYGHITDNDLWTQDDYEKCLQRGDNLGDKMLAAFNFGFKQGYEKVIIIGSDCMEINAEIINHAYRSLDSNDAVVGPATDGGYYLLGLRELHPLIFQNKKWSGENVLLDTVIDLKNEGMTYELLDTLSDIDVESDLLAAGLSI